MKVIFLGKSTCIPEKDSDSSCYIIDKKFLIDTGWKSDITLRNIGIEPLDVNHIFITHFHIDHYMGLGGLLFDRIFKKRDMSELNIYGEASTIERFVNKCLDYVDDTTSWGEIKPPVLHPLKSGDSLEIDGYKISCVASHHAVPGLCYKFEKGSSVLGVSGDTTYMEHITEFYKGCTSIVHEYSIGAREEIPDWNDICLHSTAKCAATTAQKAGVKTLYMIHGANENIPACKAQCEKYFDGVSVFPELLKEYNV